MSTYDEHVDAEIDRWVEVQLERSPELGDERIAAIWRILSEAAPAE